VTVGELIRGGEDARADALGGGGGKGAGVGIGGEGLEEREGGEGGRERQLRTEISAGVCVFV